MRYFKRDIRFHESSVSVTLSILRNGFLEVKLWGVNEIEYFSFLKRVSIIFVNRCFHLKKNIVHFHI